MDSAFTDKSLESSWTRNDRTTFKVGDRVITSKKNIDYVVGEIGTIKSHDLNDDSSIWVQFDSWNNEDNRDNGTFVCLDEMEHYVDTPKEPVNIPDTKGEWF